ncbi:MAG: glycosyltransferase family 2 protein [Thermoleophilia bacterium]|nr:glycosyltransferase family 2 protein [Thermoleophilia bacterium]
MTAGVSVVVVVLNGLPWLERCLESVRDLETVVVDHGSTDGSVELVRERFPDARLVEQGNVGMGGGNNAGMRVASGRYFLLLNPDAWLHPGAAERLVALADASPDVAVVGPRLLNPDGTLQRSLRAFPTVWRLATEYLFVRKLAPRSTLLNPLYVGGFDHAEARDADWVSGACLLVRRAATEEVGLFDEDFFMFSEETDWCYRFRRAGWRVVFCPEAEVTHVGGVSHGGSLYHENLRGHLRFLAKHRGLREAERARRMLLFALRLRGLVFRGDRGRAYRRAAAWLASAPAGALVDRPRDPG